MSEKKILQGALSQEDCDCDEPCERDMAEEQTDQTRQIIETGTVTPTKGKYVIHCLTIVGQVVIVDNEKSLAYLCDLSLMLHMPIALRSTKRIP